MKNFDEARAARASSPRDFQIGGEVFVWKASVRPEATKPWEDVTGMTPQAEVLGAIDQTVKNLIEPGVKGEAHKRWDTLRQREDDALSLGDLIGLITWLIEEQANRPTVPSSGSSNVRELPGTSSTGGSSSQDTQAA